MAAQESWFSRWLQNGRLSAICFFLVFIAYIVFQVAKIPAPLIDQLVLTFGGVLVGNLAIKKRQDDNKKVEKVEAVSDEQEKRINSLEKEVHNESPS